MLLPGDGPAASPAVVVPFTGLYHPRRGLRRTVWRKSRTVVRLTVQRRGDAWFLVVDDPTGRPGAPPATARLAPIDPGGRGWLLRGWLPAAP